MSVRPTRLKTLAAVATFSLCATVAQADVLGDLAARVCNAETVGQAIPTAQLYDQFFITSKIYLTSALYDPDNTGQSALDLRTLGVTAKACFDADEGDNAQCPSAAQKDLQTLFHNASAVVNQAAVPTDEAAVILTSREPITPENAPDYTVRLLNRDYGWLEVHCPTVQQVAQATPVPAERGRLRISDVHGNLSQPELSRAGSAWVSYMDDAITDDSKYSIQAALGLILSRPDADVTNIGYVTYIKEYSRLAGETQNDVGLGFIRSGRIGRGNPWRYELDASFHTDDRYDSRLYKLEGGLTRNFAFDNFFLCHSGETQKQVCSVGVVVEHTRVADPGDRAALLFLKQYSRIGYDMYWTHDREVNPGGLAVSVSAAHRKRYDTSGNRADAEVNRFTASVRPKKSSAYDLSLSYENGRTLIDLVRVQKTMIRLGYRR